MEEFVTAYTPYQAEISQGILQSIFEYQTQMCELIGMDVSNASVYDGAVAAAEAMMTYQERRRNSVLISEAVDPQTVAVIKTYCDSRNIPVTVLPLSDYATDLDAVVTAAHEIGAKVIMGVNPISLGLLKTPGEYGADIAVGEGQPLGLPMGFGWAL